MCGGTQSQVSGPSGLDVCRVAVKRSNMSLSNHVGRRQLRFGQRSDADRETPDVNAVLIVGHEQLDPFDSMRRIRMLHVKVC